MSLTQQTVFLDALGRLEGVGGRRHLFARALEVETRDEGLALVSSTVLLVRLHEGGTPLEEILPGANLPVARTAGGELVAVAVAGAAFWTEQVAAAARGFAELYTGEPAETRTLYVVGKTSERFEDEARKLGWAVRDEWQVMAAEDQAEPGADAR